MSPRQKNAAVSARVFWPALLLTALIGLTIRVYAGRENFMDFDEWQHVFMASSPRWTDLSFELATNAHPPLFFLLLRYLAPLGTAGFYRSISIASGAGSIVVVGLIARRILNSPVMQLLCAAVFAVSVDAISISAQVRSYQLAVFLTLLAFLAWLAMFPQQDGRIPVRPSIAFAICASLAVVSHYSVAFFLGACLIVPVLLKARFRWTEKSIALPAAAVLFPCAVFAVEYVVHAGSQPAQGYLAGFYLGDRPGESVIAFLWRNSGNFFNLFSPVELPGLVAALAMILLLSTAAAWVFFRPHAAASPAIVFPIVMIFELMAASLMRKYPFGGLLRHEYIAGPFLLIAAFVVLDALVPLAAPLLRTAIPAIILLASVGNAMAGVPNLIALPGFVMLTPEFDTWRTGFPGARAVYVDHWAAIAYFIHTTGQPRHFVRRIAADAVIDEYQTPGGIDIFYDKTRRLVSFSDPSLYQSFAACLRQAGIRQLTLFFYSAGDKPINGQPHTLKKLIVAKAAEQGLATTGIVLNETSLAAGFELK